MTYNSVWSFKKVSDSVGRFEKFSDSVGWATFAAAAVGRAFEILLRFSRVSNKRVADQ